MNTAKAKKANTLPTPATSLKVNVETLQHGSTLYRVHSDKFDAVQFNPGLGNARFSPIADQTGTQIPTIYAANNLAVALMETVFHDIPHTAGLKTYDVNKLTGRVVSVLEVTQNLQLAKLTGPSARKLGISEAELIHSTADCYPQTRQWAEAIHSQYPDIHGLVWVSRQHSDGKAYLLFGDRMPSNPFNTLRDKAPILSTDDVVRKINELADEMGVELKDNNL